MSTEETWQTESSSLAASLAFAAEVGSRLRGGEIFELVGDVGSGKTSFVRGLAKGLGCDSQVHSPSFTIRNDYKCDGKTLYHLDFYRITEPGIMEQALTEILDDPEAVVAVEWSDIVAEVLPSKRIQVRINTPSEVTRSFRFAYPPSRAYLFPGKPSSKT
jgi:tRNA threonylcarbamoyladenosine biosynthesis protein TsaE